jgi:hypothetical protein
MSEPSNYSLPSTVANLGTSDLENTQAEMSRRNSDRASLTDLKNFIGRVEAEQKRLSRFGTTDPIIQARLDGLSRIKNDVTDIINKVINKQMREDEIPIKKSEINDALRKITQGNVPSVLSTSASNNLPMQALFTALEPRMPGVKSGQAQYSALEANMLGINNVPHRALKHLAKQTTVSVNYSDTLYGIMSMLGIPGFDSPQSASASASAPRSSKIQPALSDPMAPPLPNPVTNPQVMTELYDTMTRHALDGSTLATYTGFTEPECQKSCSDNDQCDGYNFRWGNIINPECTLLSGSKTFVEDLYTDASRKKQIQGFSDMSSKPAVFSAIPPTMPTNSLYKAPYPMRTTDWVYNGGESAILGRVGHFDWKERSKQITDQIRKRNMNPANFGALNGNVQVSPNFSWKGYTQMLCTRLTASYDTGLAVACGCPPIEWLGWQSPTRS